METPQPNSGNANAGNDGAKPEDMTLLRGPGGDANNPASTASLDQFAELAGTVVCPIGSVPDEADEKAETVIRRSDVGSSVRSPAPSAAATPAEVAKVLLGSRLSHFQLEELIGGGGMGAVFRARDERLDRTVAIKVIPFIGDDPDMQRRFRNEAQSAARLDHPNIARVFDVGMFEGWRYIVFEYIEGTNIRDLVSQEGVLTIDDAVFYTRQIAEALHHASGRGVVHRDVKPSNILVNTDGDTKLVDMGLARSDQLDMSGDMTASGVTLGTFDYISPEQARDPRDADVRSDIYSLGCTLYFMLTGSPPYPGGTMLQKLLNHGNAPPPDPAGLRPGLSEDLKAIIQKMLAKSPDVRYQRAIDLVADLRELAFREGLVRAQSQGTLTIKRDESPLGQFATHLPWLVAASLMLAGAMMLQVMASLRSNTFTLEIPASAVAMRPLSNADLERIESSQIGGSDRGAPVTLGSPDFSGSALDNFPTIATGDRDPSPRPTGESVTAGETAAVSTAGGGAETVGDTAQDANANGRSVTGDEALGDVAAIPPKYTELALPREALGASGLAPKDPAKPVTKVEKIVIGATSGSPNLLAASTLAEAMRLAEELGINTIEIAVEVIDSPPIRIPRDGMVIRSVVGATEIRFAAGQVPAMQRTVMVDVGSHRVDFQNLHFVWNVRSASIDGGTLFSLSDNRLVRLTDCTISIENLTEREEVFAFEITSPSAGRGGNGGIGLLMQDPLSLRVGPEIVGPLRVTEPTALSSREVVPQRIPIPPLVAIEMNNVSARGEMTLVNVVDAVQLQLRWDNGLLAVSRRMLDVAGVDVPTSTAGNQIQLLLNRLTTWTGEGLVRTRLGPSGVYPMLIDRDSRNVVFRSGANAPHVEFTGVESAALASPEQLVNLRGEDNAYDFQPDEDWPMLVLATGAGERQVHLMSQMIGTSRPAWDAERSPRWVVRWSEPIDETTPASRLIPANFLQDGTVISGFDRARLPNFPEKSVADSVPPTAAGS